MFDEAHKVDHVSKVISNSLSIASDYDADINKIYVIAAYHDIGLQQGRKDHEKHSSAFLLSDEKLKEWFSADELTLMSEAIEDHRASNDYEPRSIYGKIVSEADRDLDYITVLTRCIQYGIEYFADYTYNQQLQRVYEHLQEKYGENGYIKLWLNTEHNRNSLSLIRTNLASADKFKSDFTRIYNECKKQALSADFDG